MPKREFEIWRVQFNGIFSSKEKVIIVARLLVDNFCCFVEQSAVINPNEEKKRKGHTTRPIVISYRFAVKEEKQKAERLDGKPKRKL